MWQPRCTTRGRGLVKVLEGVGWGGGGGVHLCRVGNTETLLHVEGVHDAPVEYIPE